MLCDPMDYTVHGILQARIREWVVFSLSRRSFQPRGRTQISCIAGGFFTNWPQGKPKNTGIGSLSLLQQIFLTQELNQGLLHCRWILYQLSYQGIPHPTPRVSPNIIPLCSALWLFRNKTNTTELIDWIYTVPGVILGCFSSPEISLLYPLKAIDISPSKKTSLICAQLCPTLCNPMYCRTVARQAPLSMGLSRQEYWSGLPFPTPGDLPNARIESASLALQVDSLPLSHQRRITNPTEIGNNSDVKRPSCQASHWTRKGPSTTWLISSQISMHIPR